VAIKKFCNSVWGTNDTDKTITLFFNVISLYINTLLTSVTKFFYSRQIEFLAPWPATAHYHWKTSFREGATSDVEIGRSRWVSGRVSKVGETAAQTRCPSLWPVQLETCELEHYRAATADLGSEYPSASPSLPDADLSALHRSMVQSLLSSVVCNPPAARLCNPRHLWPWARNFLGGGELTLFHCTTPVWCLDPNGESMFHHQLLCGTTRCPGLHCRYPAAPNMFPPKMTSQQVSENMGPIRHGHC